MFDDGLPDYGNGFVTQGFIYEDGTRGAHDGVVVDDDGTGQPEFSDKVIGEWTCYGYFIGEGARETDDAWGRDDALARGEIEQTTNGHNGTDGVNGDFSATLAPGRLSLPDSN